MDYILRNHDKNKLEEQKQSFINITNTLNEKYGKDVVKLTLRDSYSNMAEYIKKDPKSVEFAIKAMHKLGIKEVIEDFKSGCTVLSGCGNVNITKFDIDWDDWEDDWDDEDTSCILVEEFHL
jgi:di/tripeptidase